MAGSHKEVLEYGLIGFPLEHSFSPAYFTEKFRQEHIDARYSAFPLPDISGLIPLLEAHPHLRGLNVTLPYKTSVIPYLSSLSMEASAIGAVNCLSIGPAGITGFNTDWSAFRDSLQPLLKPHQKKALVLGNGGAAKAVVYALRLMQIDFQVVSRGGGSNMLSYQDLSPALIARTYLLINTTPLGMYPDEDRAPEIPYQALTSGHLLYDLIYRPEETLFLAKGKARHAVTKNGLEMLRLQAEASWKIWNEPERPKRL